MCIKHLYSCGKFPNNTNLTQYIILFPTVHNTWILNHLNPKESCKWSVIILILNQGKK